MRDTPIVAALLAAKFAQELGLPTGNDWEPPVSRKILVDLRAATESQVEEAWRLRLGLND